MKTPTDKETEPLEIVEAFYRLLTEHEVPEGWTLSDLPPKMTGAQAFSLIYYLQEGPGVFPDHIEHCEECDRIVDSWGEQIRYVESEGKHLCESCYSAVHAYECCACDKHDCHDAPGRLAVLGGEVGRLTPGLYRIPQWPVYADGMIEGFLFEGSFERIGEVPPGVDLEGYEMGFLCADCEKLALTKTQAA